MRQRAVYYYKWILFVYVFYLSDHIYIESILCPVITPTLLRLELSVEMIIGQTDNR